MARLTVLLCFTIFLRCGAGSDDNDIGYFWHVTDFHYDHTFNDKLSCNSDITGQLPAYGDYWCDATWRLVVDSIQAMKNIRPDVDFLIWTGDSVAHISDKNLSTQVNLQVVQNVTDQLDRIFKDTPVYASLGNHDFYPSGQASPKAKDSFYSNITDLWQDWVINQSNAIDDSRTGGYYAVKLKVNPKIRLLALNTNLYYTSDKLTFNISDPVGQFAWMEKQLQEATSNGEKVILTGHVPPGLFFPEYSDWYWPDFKTRFMSIILKYSDIIVALNFGHDHYDSFKILQTNDGRRAVPQFIAPSVTPWRYKKQQADGVVKTGDAHNPGLRLVKYSRTSGAHLDYSQYYINITAANDAGGTAVWKILYNFTSTYGVDDMSVGSLRKIFAKLEDNDSPLYQKFCNNWVVSDSDKRCTDSMKVDIYCGGQQYDLQAAQKCSEDRLKKINGEPCLQGKSSLVLALLLISIINWVK